MQLTDFWIYALPGIFLEISAALVGTYYLKKGRLQFKNTNYLVLFLWFTVLLETLGCYAPIAYFSDYKYFAFVVGTPFENNFWLFNLYGLTNFSFFAFYFISFLKNKYWRNIFYLLIGSFIGIAGIVMTTTGSFFKEPSRFVAIVGTMLLFVGVVLFYFELLRSNILLQVKRFLPFYVSVGVLVFNLCITPIDILSQYFSVADGNELFVKLHLNVLLFANIFMYSTFIFGFIICSRKKKSY